MDLIVTSRGQVRALYTEAFDLAALGPLQIRRASQVEPDAHGAWSADLTPVGGPVLGPFARRSAALAAEVVWLTAHDLPLPDPTRPLDRSDNASS